MKNTLRTINDYALSAPSELVFRAERHYRNEIYAVADLIAENDDLKIVSIAGPSASGKTTTAHILCDRLKELGETTEVVSLDDFYLPTEKLPIAEDGTKDIESVRALDIELLKECLNNIILTGKTNLPRYDFAGKKRILNDRKIDISHRGIVIAEGLHALNPIITDLVPAKNIFKAYISVNRCITDEDGGQILSSRQIRLIRRTLRDRIFRGSSINDTLSLWNGVVEGEKKYLYCFKEQADVQIKTLHIYEPCLYRNGFLALQSEIDENSVCYDYFMKTANSLKKFASLESTLVPEDSLIREFIGNGKYNRLEKSGIMC